MGLNGLPPGKKSAAPVGWGAAIAAALMWTLPAYAAAAVSGEPPAFFGIPVDFLLFAATLLGVAVFHHHTLRVANSRKSTGIPKNAGGSFGMAAAAHTGSVHISAAAITAPQPTGAAEFLPGGNPSSPIAPS